MSSSSINASDDDESVDVLSSPDLISTDSTWSRLAVFKQLGLLAAGREPTIGISIYDLCSKQFIRSIQNDPYIWDLKPFKENKLIGACEDGKIFIWNVETGQLLISLEGHSGRDVYVIGLSKNETSMLSGGQDDNMILWDMVNYRQMRTFTGHTGWVHAVIFNEPSDQVISGSVDTTIRVWDMNDGSLVDELIGHENTVTKLVLDEETGLLFSVCADYMIKMWNLEMGVCFEELKGHTNDVDDLILNQQSGWLASSSHDRSIIIWNKDTGSIIKRVHYTDGLCKLALNPLNEQLIITCGLSGQIIFWNYNDSKNLSN